MPACFSYKSKSPLGKVTIPTMEAVDIEEILSPVNDKDLFQPLTYYEESVPDEELTSITLCDAYNYWLDLPEDMFKEEVRRSKREAISKLIWEDIQLGIKRRCNKPSACQLYGLPLVLNSAFYLCYAYVDRLKDVPDRESNDRINKDLSDMLLSHMLNFYWSRNFVCPTEEEYLDATVQTGKITYQFAFNSMQWQSENKTDYNDIIKPLSIFIEIRNDYRMVSFKCPSEVAYLGKRKMVFPIVHAINTRPAQKDNLINIISRDFVEDAGARKLLQALLEKCGSLEYTRKKLGELRAELLEKIDAVGGNPVLVDLLDF